MNDFAVDPPRRHAAQVISGMKDAQDAANVGGHALVGSREMLGLQALARDELSQLRASMPIRKFAVPIDPVASYIDWDLAVDGLSLAG